MKMEPNLADKARRRIDSYFTFVLAYFPISFLSTTYVFIISNDILNSFLPFMGFMLGVAGAPIHFFIITPLTIIARKKLSPDDVNSNRKALAVIILSILALPMCLSILGAGY